MALDQKEYLSNAFDLVKRIRSYSDYLHSGFIVEYAPKSKEEWRYYKLLLENLVICGNVFAEVMKDIDKLYIYSSKGTP